MSTATQRRAPAKPKILEKHVQEGVTALLELDGWRPLRTDPVSDRYRGKGFGELGMPDHLYIRYWAGYRPGAVKDCENHADLITEAQVLWVEYKAPSKEPKPHQLQWHAAETRRGALVLVVDDFDKFREWYRDSGLNRSLIVALPAKGRTA